MIPHPQYDQFCRVLGDRRRGWLRAPFAGVVYRYTSSKYAKGRDLLSGAGAFRAGGRWNAPETFHAVYCASDPELANREYFAGCRLAGIAPRHAMPLTGKAVAVDLAAALDARSPRTLEALGVAVDDLFADPCKRSRMRGGNRSARRSDARRWNRDSKPCRRPPNTPSNLANTTSC